ncbi:MAG: hemerythrin domain-containing protein [Actinobacteria bacterium]|nr:hemerythrin domain-containing protein [Actinomycetota bacterium]
MIREHRLIERMLVLLEQEMNSIRSDYKADPVFIGTAVDFFRTYADRTHHGKEEELYFKGLAGKNLDPELGRVMEELVEDHRYGRAKVRELQGLTDRYIQGDQTALGEMEDLIAELVRFYTAHIIKEDKHFFFPTQEYFSREEQDAMLNEFKEFDSKMIHEKYALTIEQLQNER